LSGNLQEPYVIAEISANHGGDIQNAKLLISGAKEAGANAVKLQTFTADSITVNSLENSFSIPPTSALWAGKNLYELMKRAETPFEWHEELIKYSSSLDLEILSTAYDIPSVDFLLQLGIKGIKISSFDLINYPLLNYLAKSQVLVLISTGMGTVQEIDTAARIFSHRKNITCLLQCTSSYPCSYHDVNMNRHNSLKKYGYITGYSDHTTSNIAAIMAVANGAKIFEKHICLNGLDTLDSKFSLDSKKFKIYVDEIWNAFTALGDFKFNPTQSESASLWERPSVVAIADIEKGALLSEMNIGIRRPAVGSKPEFYDKFLKSTANRYIKTGEGIFEDSILQL
jgi:sialic acid synthase SpsE